MYIIWNLGLHFTTHLCSSLHHRHDRCPLPPTFPSYLHCYFPFRTIMTYTYLLLVHSYGSKFPSTTILHLQRFGLPFSSYLIVDIAMVGRALPTEGRSSWYCCSVMCVHVGKSSNPKYSSSYDCFHNFLSWSSNLCICRSVGASRFLSEAADTCRATLLERQIRNMRK